MGKNYFWTILSAVLWLAPARAQTCYPVDMNTTVSDPEGISRSECIDVSGVFKPYSPWPTEPDYPVWSGTQINVKGESQISAENARAVTLFVVPLPVMVRQLVPATGNALKFEKVEFGLRLTGEAETQIQNFVNETPGTVKLNPFDPLHVDIRAEFEHEFSAYQWELRGRQYGFYYREYERDTSGPGSTWHRNEIPVAENFRVRYAPDKTGNWRVRFTVYLKDIGTYTTLYSYFFVAPSDNPGYLKVSADGRYFERGGEFFYPVGQNQSYPACVSPYCSDMPSYIDASHTWGLEAYQGKSPVKAYTMYHKVLQKMHDGGANYFRMLVNEWGLDIEYEKLGNYYGRQEQAWELDRILDKAHELDLLLTFNMALHTRFEDASEFDFRLWDWTANSCNSLPGYCYASIPGVNSPRDMLTNATARRYYKNRLRYLVARYGYSTNIGIWELVSEINNLGQGKIVDNNNNCVVIAHNEKSYTTYPTTVPHQVYKWQDEMLGYIKNDLLLREHPTGVCYAGDECRLDWGDSSYYSPNVDYIGFNNGEFHLNRFGWLKSTFLPKYRTALLNKPLIHSEITYVGFDFCDQYTEWYKNMWVPPFVGLALATTWSYQFHLTYPYISLYGNLNKFLRGSDFRNINGYTWQNDQADDYDTTYRAFMYFMKGVKGNDKRAEGVVLSRNFNFYTNRPHNFTRCDSVTWNQLLPLNFIPSDTLPEDVPYDPDHKLKIPDMNVNGVTQCYKVYWYDPATGDWFFTDTQYSNVSQGYLTIQHPTLTSRIPGWQNMDLHSGIRPLLAFKVRRCSEDPPEGFAEGTAVGDPMGLVRAGTAEETRETAALDPATVIRIFPNPTTDLLQVEVPASYLGSAWGLFSATGTVLNTGRLETGSVRLSLSGFAPGMYGLKVIRKDGHTETFKIIKQ